MAGFWVALWQIRKTKSSADSAKAAAEDAATRLENSSALILIPQLQECGSELVRAVHANQQELLLKLITRWRWQAGQLRGLLDDEEPTHKRTNRNIQTSITVAGQLRSLTSEKGAPDAELGSSQVAAVAKVTADFGELSQLTLRKVDLSGSA
ncbi:hypothetical protein AR689_02235 [Arthrobacter sp. EpRS71]|nr:hypothetical protein AR689_02235 [Arthrobacter sp. EpRS71]